MQRHRNNESRRNRDVQPSLPGRSIRVLLPFPSLARVLSHLIRRTSISLDLQLLLPHLASRRTWSLESLFLAPSHSFCLPFSFFQTFLDNCVRKCVSGMMHGGREQKGRKEKGRIAGRKKRRRRSRRAHRRRRGGTSYGNEEMQ